MIDIPNCENCPNDRCCHHPISSANNLCGSSIPSLIIREFTSINGCLSHPISREYLMQGIIDELEKEVKGYERYTIEGDGYSGISQGMKKAIALIRIGVDKK